MNTENTFSAACGPLILIPCADDERARARSIEQCAAEHTGDARWLYDEAATAWTRVSWAADDEGRDVLASVARDRAGYWAIRADMR